MVRYLIICDFYQTLISQPQFNLHQFCQNRFFCSTLNAHPFHPLACLLLLCGSLKKRIFQSQSAPSCSNSHSRSYLFQFLHDAKSPSQHHIMLRAITILFHSHFIRFLFHLDTLFFFSITHLITTFG